MYWQELFQEHPKNPKNFVSLFLEYFWNISSLFLEQEHLLDVHYCKHLELRTSWAFFEYRTWLLAYYCLLSYTINHFWQAWVAFRAKAGLLSTTVVMSKESLQHNRQNDLLHSHADRIAHIGRNREPLIIDHGERRRYEQREDPLPSP